MPENVQAGVETIKPMENFTNNVPIEKIQNPQMITEGIMSPQNQGVVLESKDYEKYPERPVTVPVDMRPITMEVNQVVMDPSGVPISITGMGNVDFLTYQRDQNLMRPHTVDYSN